MSSFTSICGWIGFGFVLRFAFFAARSVWVYFLRPGRKLRKLGSWAVVTGATDGIGRALCDVLASKGLNVLLISRTESKLAAAADDIASKYRVKTKFCVVDFAHADEAVWRRVASEVLALDVGILFNNVGLSYDYPEYYDQLSEAATRNIVETNITSVNQMTRILLPAMKEHHKGAIVNVGSAAGSIAPSSPLMGVYAGTKAYVDLFSKSLQGELATTGVTVQVMAPFFVATKMSKIRRASLGAPSAAQWARAAVRHIGYETTSCPYWFHALQWYGISIAPAWLINWYVLNMHLGIRTRSLKKRNAKAQ